MWYFGLGEILYDDKYWLPVPQYLLPSKLVTNLFQSLWTDYFQMVASLKSHNSIAVGTSFAWFAPDRLDWLSSWVYRVEVATICRFLKCGRLSWMWGELKEWGFACRRWDNLLIGVGVQEVQGLLLAVLPTVSLPHWAAFPHSPKHLESPVRFLPMCSLAKPRWECWWELQERLKVLLNFHKCLFPMPYNSTRRYFKPKQSKAYLAFSG